MADGSLRTFLHHGLGSLEEAVASVFWSPVGVLLYVLQVWFSLSSDSPSSIFCFVLLQDRAVRELIFDTVFHQRSHTKSKLALAFLGLLPAVAGQGLSWSHLWPRCC